MKQKCSIKFEWDLIVFQIILVVILVYYIYRLYSKRKIASAKKKRPRPFYHHAPPYSENKSQSRVIEEMKRCPSCGTFNPKSYALFYEEEFFCGLECKNKRN